MATTLELLLTSRLSTNNEATNKELKTIYQDVKDIASATGNRDAKLTKTFARVKNSVVHNATLELWQFFHDSMLEIPILVTYARRMERFSNELIGIINGYNAAGLPLPCTTEQAVIAWNPRTGLFTFYRGYKEELAHVRKRRIAVNFVKFRIGTPDKDPVRATQEALASKVERARKSTKALVKELGKKDNGVQTEKLLVQFMCELAQTAVPLTDYARHMLHAHNAAMEQKLAGRLAEIVANTPVSDAK